MDGHLGVGELSIVFALRIPLRDLPYSSLMHALSCDN